MYTLSYKTLKKIIEIFAAVSLTAGSAEAQKYYTKNGNISFFSKIVTAFQLASRISQCRRQWWGREPYNSMENHPDPGQFFCAWCVTSVAAGEVYRFRPGLHLSREHPLNHDQIKGLLDGLRFWSGLGEIRFDAEGDLRVLPANNEAAFRR